jgi:hypothetical protein
LTKKDMLEVYSSFDKYLTNPKKIQKNSVSTVNIDWAYLQDMNDNLWAARILI